LNHSTIFHTDLVKNFRTIVGAKNIYQGEDKTAYYRSGFRSRAIK